MSSKCFTNRYFPVSLKSLKILKSCLLFLLFANFTSCSKSDDGTVPDGESPTFSVSIQENFARDPLKNIRNIYVGDTIFYDINIESDTPGKDAVYILNLNSNDDPGHRRLDKDYSAYIIKSDTLKAHKGDKVSSSALPTKKQLLGGKIQKGTKELKGAGKYVLALVPLRPGTFVENFSFKEKAEMGERPTLYKQINFNCVRLTAWVQKVQTQHSTVFRHSKHRNDFYIRIDDGTEENDKYLASQDGRTQSYTIDYDGKIYHDTFEEGKDICFMSTGTREGASPEINTDIIKRITISQRDAARSNEVIIEFNKIQLIIKPE